MNGIKIIFAIIMVFDFFGMVWNNKEKTAGEIIFTIVKFFLFIIIVANKEFF